MQPTAGDLSYLVNLKIDSIIVWDFLVTLKPAEDTIKVHVLILYMLFLCNKIGCSEH